MPEVPCRVPGGDRLEFAQALVHALAGEGRLQGQLEAGYPDPQSSVLVVLYYVEDASVDTLLDSKVAKARIRGATRGSGRLARIRHSASFNWIDQDVRARHIHHFMVQPCNALVVIEGALSHEELRLRAPVPIWGSICFHASQPSWRKDFDRQNYCAADTVLGQAVRNIQSALHSIDGVSRRRAVQKVERRMDRIHSRLLHDRNQA